MRLLLLRAVKELGPSLEDPWESCACQSAGTAPLLLWRRPLRSAARYERARRAFWDACAPGHGCACQSAGIAPLLLWRPPLRSAAWGAALKGLDGMLTRARGLAAEWLCCLHITPIR